MKVLLKQKDLHKWRLGVPPQKKIGFVPTMGALHGGHLSLIKNCVSGCDVSVVSIFLNPRQFEKIDDLKTYPCDLEGDLKKIKKLNVDVVFCPDPNEMYGDEDFFVLKENHISKTLEGKSRLGFFDGVLTVVSKLFNLFSPHCAYFGKKDAQQLWLIKKMVKSMKYPIQIIECETLREESGLAMSSRNSLLSKNIRSRASVIFKSLLLAKNLFLKGEFRVKKIKALIDRAIKSDSNFNVDYISIVELKTFKGCIKELNPNHKYLVLIAVNVNNVRLIDNIEL